MPNLRKDNDTAQRTWNLDMICSAFSVLCRRPHASRNSLPCVWWTQVSCFLHWQVTMLFNARCSKEIWLCVLLLMYDIWDFIMLYLITSDKNILHTFSLKINICNIPSLLCQVPYTLAYKINWHVRWPEIFNYKFDLCLICYIKQQ